MATDRGDDYENDLYQLFPEGSDDGHGSDDGFNTYVTLNDPSLFTEEALRNPAINAFANSGNEISISFAQFKSSTRESEWSLHKPHLTMNAERGREHGLPPGLDIKGSVAKYPGPEHAHIATFIVNHELSMARWKQSVILVEDGKQAGQMIYKHPPPEEPATESAGE